MRSTARYAVLVAAVTLTLAQVNLLGQAPAADTPAPASAASAAAAPAKVPATEVPVKVVVLFSSGVGYFEHFGTVDGNATAELRFKGSQINDILKSLVLQDLDKGKITTITYPSQDPLEKTLASFQVDITENPSLGDLLNQLRGAKVNCVGRGDERLTGTIIGVEQQQRPGSKDEDKPITVSVVNLLSGGTIRSMELNSLRSIELEDKQLQEELEKALLAVSQSRGKDKKPVVIQFAGAGQRRVRLGYVVETPIWKTSYRLILPSPGAPAPAANGGAGAGDQKPILQGWAIVENQTDTDWSNVQLSLVSGRPISFVQDLYQPLYIPRPVVKPELYASLRPQEYGAGMGGEEAKAAVAEAAAPMTMAPAPAAMPAGRASAAAQPMRKMQQQLKSSSETHQMMDELVVAGDVSRGWDANAAQSVAAAASAGKLGELFQYTVSAPVVLPRQKSAMLPILNDAVDAERVSIYNAAVLGRNPLSGVILTNTSGKHLLQGPITVLDAGSYAGDARINDVPPGQNRLLSYGIDLQVLIDSTSRKQESTVTSGKIVKGVLNLQRKNLFTQQYKIENKSDKDKTLIVEHPFRQNWKLLEPAKAMETTDTLYRFRQNVPAGKQAALDVKEEVTQWETFALLPADIDGVVLYSKNAQIPQAVRDALTVAAQKKQAIVDTQREIDQTRQKINDTSNAQNRTRENMKAIDPSARKDDYYNRLLKRLSDQDATMDTLQKTQDDLQQKQTAQQKDLADYLNGLSIGGALVFKRGSERNR